MRTKAPISLTRRAALAGALTLCAMPASAAPKSRLIDPLWQRTGSAGDPDARPWAAFLDTWHRTGRDGVARVDYRGAREAGAGEALSAWLQETQRIDPTTLTPMAAMAWWLNLYNAATVDLVLSAYPVGSIREIKGGLFNTGPWGEKILSVNATPLSLDDVEHGILRPIWRDPRIHYGVNCASIGCPDLLRAPFSSETLDQTLEAAARAYVNHPRGARVEDGRLIVSKIYDWFQEDFGGTEAGVIAHLSRHAEGALAKDLAAHTHIARYAYDWALNEP